MCFAKAGDRNEHSDMRLYTMARLPPHPVAAYAGAGESNVVSTASVGVPDEEEYTAAFPVQDTV